MNNKINDGMRFNVIAIVHEFPNTSENKVMEIHKVMHRQDIPYSRVPYEVHFAGLKYGHENVRLEPARLYTSKDFGFLD